MLYQFLATVKRNGVPAIFYFATITCGIVIAHWTLLPRDTSSMPLFIITMSQCCLLGLWLAHRSESWLSRILAPIVLVGLTSTLRWATDGMPVPANLLWLSVYALDGLVPLAGVTCCALLLGGTTKHGGIKSQSKMRFSVADLLFVTTISGIAILTVMLSPPSLSDYQYTCGLRDTAQQMVASVLPVVASALIVFRIMEAPILRMRALTLTLFCTLIVGVLTARFMGIHANPLWGTYALAPCLTTLLVALALLAHRYTIERGSCCDHVLESCDDGPNNHAMHTERRFVSGFQMARSPIAAG